MKNKRGSYGDVFIFIVMSFLIVTFFGLMYYGFSQVDDVLTGIELTFGDGTGYNDFQNIVDDTWGEVYDAYDQLKTLAYVLIFGMIITILIGSWAVKSHPIFFVIYIIVCIGAIIVSAYVSNVYQGMLLNADFGATLQSFKGGSYILLYLPYISTVITMVGAFVMFIGLNKNKTTTGLPV